MTLPRFGGMLLPALVLALLLSGCGSHPKPPALDALGAVVSGGGQSLFAPAHQRRWQGTVGSFALCLRRPGPPVRIIGVRVLSHEGLRPLRARVFDRLISPKMARGFTKKMTGRFMEIGSTLGAPPTWSGFGTGPLPAGHFSPRLHGLTVMHTCKQRDQARQQLFDGRTPRTTTHELVLTFDVASRGARINGFDIHYRAADGREGVARERWDIMACGSAIHDAMMCPRGSWG